MVRTDRELLDAARRVKLVVLDFDGVVTDGGLYLSTDGSSAKKAHFLDIMGISRWRRRGGEAARGPDRADWKWRSLNLCLGRSLFPKPAGLAVGARWNSERRLRSAARASRAFETGRWPRVHGRQGAGSRLRSAVLKTASSTTESRIHAAIRGVA